jgi:alanine-glyoxylate transaminase/serine-glyoxylate transaminase/serine-pyruvate transaminase
VAAWGLDLVAEHRSLYSDTVSAIRVPQGVDARDVIDTAYRKYRTSLGTGLAQLAGKVFRIGHLGDLNEVMCLSALGAAEMALVQSGAKIELGSGVAAAQAWYLDAPAEASWRIAAE